MLFHRVAVLIWTENAAFVLLSVFRFPGWDLTFDSIQIIFCGDPKEKRKMRFSGGLQTSRTEAVWTCYFIWAHYVPDYIYVNLLL